MEFVARVLVQIPAPKRHSVRYHGFYSNVARGKRKKNAVPTEPSSPGVPAFDPDAGVDYIGKPADYSQKKRDEYTNTDYHKPSDQIKPDWDLAGAADDAKLFLAMGYRVAQAGKYPEWRLGNEFRSIREAALARKK